MYDYTSLSEIFQKQNKLKVVMSKNDVPSSACPCETALSFLGNWQGRHLGVPLTPLPPSFAVFRGFQFQKTTSLNIFSICLNLANKYCWSFGSKFILLPILITTKLFSSAPLIFSMLLTEEETQNADSSFLLVTPFRSPKLSKRSVHAYLPSILSILNFFTLNFQTTMG